MVTTLVAGSSGYVGARLVAALVAAGHDVVATARDPAKLDGFDWPATVGRLALDVSSAAECDRAFAEAGRVDVAYYLIHSIGDADFAERDLQDARSFAKAAEGHGVGRIVYLGGFVPGGEQLSEHLSSRADVGRALGETGVPLVWLRAAVILGAGSTSYELIRYLAERVAVVPMPTWIEQRVSPIAIDDVLRYLVAAGDPGLVPAGAYDISNGESLTYADVIKRYAEVNGLRRVWLPLPAVSTTLAAPVVAELTPIPKELVIDLVHSLANSMEAAESRIRSLVADPAGGLTTLDDAIVRAAVGADFVPAGVCASADPLQLTATDPPWAGGDAYRKARAARSAREEQREGEQHHH